MPAPEQMPREKPRQKKKRANGKRKRKAESSGFSIGSCISPKKILIVFVGLCIGSMTRAFFSPAGPTVGLFMFSSGLQLSNAMQKLKREVQQEKQHVEAAGSTQEATDAEAGANAVGANAVGENEVRENAVGANTVAKAVIANAVEAKVEGAKAVGSKAEGSKAEGSKAEGSKVVGGQARSNRSHSIRTSGDTSVGDQCHNLAAEHHVEIGTSWGTLPQTKQVWWAEHACDKELLVYYRNDLKKQNKANLRKNKPKRSSKDSGSKSMSSNSTGSNAASENDVLSSLKARFMPEDMERCKKMQTIFAVVIGKSWGSLKEKGQEEWNALRCDLLDENSRDMIKAEVSAMGTYEQTIKAAIVERQPTEIISREAQGEVPVLAVGIASSTRGLRVTKSRQLSLFKRLLPSLARTAEKGIEYWLYIAYDKGDKFWDNASRLSTMRAEIDKLLVQKLRKRKKPITCRFAFLRFDNTMRKPGPVFNFMMGSAYADGADYLYRVNDDTEFQGPFAGTAIRALKARTPANIGVVGPICKQGNQDILTHDLVHRQHLEIFDGIYYPPILSDWWMDDWITHVYGKERTQWGPFIVVHHINSHKTRYQVDFTHKKSLQTELAKGAARIAQWVAKQEQKPK